MAEQTQLLGGLSRSQRMGLVAGVLLIVATLAGVAWWVMQRPQAVLFSDLAAQDAAVLSAELDKLKEPYRFTPDGQSILIAQDAVHRVRLALMSRQLPLQGAVGFELFNNTDFGVSDFVQKVNYQRALQGELTRTILSIGQIQSARVHLAMPEQQLFRRDSPRAKASVTLVMRPGQSLASAQVSGIQRLIAASVPDTRAEDVVVVDQNGAVLSRQAGGDEATSALQQLDTKASLEQHLARKATQLLERMYPVGTSLVTVDVALSHQQSRVVTESVLPATAATAQQAATGVVVRDRTVTRDTPDSERATAPHVTTQETDYAVGRRTEQVSSPGGHVSRINVAVVVRSPLTDAESLRVRTLIGTAVGVDPARGDAVAVYSMADGALRSVDGGAPAAAASASSSTSKHSPGTARDEAPESIRGSMVVLVLSVLAAVAAALAGAMVWRRRAEGGSPSGRLLNDDEREALFVEVREWLGTPANGGRV